MIMARSAAIAKESERQDPHPPHLIGKEQCYDGFAAPVKSATVILWDIHSADSSPRPPHRAVILAANRAQPCVTHGPASGKLPAMKIEGFLKNWGTALTFLFGTLGFLYATTAFVRDFIYVRDDLQMSVIGEVDTNPPANKQDQITMRLAVVNAGTRDAAVLQANVMALRTERRGYGWDRVWPPTGQGFESRTIKPGEISIISLVTDSYAHKDYFRNPKYSRRIDDTHHEFNLGIWVQSMDSRGRLYSAYFAVQQFKVPNDITNGPTDGYTFDCHPHQLLVNIPEFNPPLAKNYDDANLSDCAEMYR
jgi:hypothetical protein